MKMGINNMARHVETDGLLIGATESFTTQGGGNILFHR